MWWQSHNLSAVWERKGKKFWLILVKGSSISTGMDNTVLIENCTHNFWHHFYGTIYCSLSLLVPSILTFQICCWNISSNEKVMSIANSRNETDNFMFKSMKNWRKCCRKLQAFLFAATYAFGKMCFRKKNFIFKSFSHFGLNNCWGMCTVYTVRSVNHILYQDPFFHIDCISVEWDVMMIQR